MTSSRAFHAADVPFAACIVAHRDRSDVLVGQCDQTAVVVQFGSIVAAAPGARAAPPPGLDQRRVSAS